MRQESTLTASCFRSEIQTQTETIRRCGGNFTNKHIYRLLARAVTPSLLKIRTGQDRTHVAQCTKFKDCVVVHAKICFSKSHGLNFVQLHSTDFGHGHESRAEAVAPHLPAPNDEQSKAPGLLTMYCAPFTRLVDLHRGMRVR